MEPLSVTFREQAKREREDLASAYRNMMQMSAWRHFSDHVLKKIETQAVLDEDGMDLKDFNEARFGEFRGRRDAIRRIFREIDFVLGSVNIK